MRNVTLRLKGQRFEQVDLDILLLLAQGATHREIAQKTQLSELAVRQRLPVIFDRLGVEDRAGATVEAMRQGLV